MEYKGKVFLSGGFRSNWQEKVIEGLKDEFIFFNPREHRLEKSKEYTAWDIHFIKQCDIFFAYMESTNPSGYGLAFELGLALGLNKTIILVDERSSVDHEFAKYFKIVQESSNTIFPKIEQGIEYLKKYSSNRVNVY